jgi:hypothetical protein
MAQVVAEGRVVDPEKGLQIGPDLWVRELLIAEVQEQAVNAQTLQPRKFDRLVENIRSRQALESMPYCSRPNDEGPTFIVSGHHRMRAARSAGLDRMWAIVDTLPMTLSQTRAKQIAHNELAGEPDPQILAQMVGQIDNVDDLLHTGLDETMLPTVAADDTALQLPHADFDFRLVALSFLPAQLAEFGDAVKVIESRTDILGVARVDQFDAFSKALMDYGRRFNVKSMATVVSVLTELARREIEAADAAEAGEAAAQG